MMLLEEESEQGPFPTKEKIEKKEEISVKKEEIIKEILTLS